MAAFTTAVVIASAGDLSMTSGIPISFSVTWGSNISPLRWSRVWAGIVSPGDADSAQRGTIQSEGSAWNLLSPASTPMLVTLRVRPARGQRAALLEVPRELEGLKPRELHAAVAVKLQNDGPRLVKRKR